MRKGIVDLPLHYGKAPAWLMERMIKLSRRIIELIISKYGADRLLDRLADPYWFQSLGNFLGFDWHSSGLTTTLCGAIKEAIRGNEKYFGIIVVGGKGKTSLKTPDEIQFYAEHFAFDPFYFIKVSKISAKVDNSCLQDGYSLYHHTLIFSLSGEWVVIQQGMNTSTAYARRYHWRGNRYKNLIVEPHSGIISNIRHKKVIDLTSNLSNNMRKRILELSKEKPDKNLKELNKIKRLKLTEEFRIYQYERLDIKRFQNIFYKICDQQPKDFISLLSIEGVGAKTLRALTLLAHLIYGDAPSFKDPAKFSFAHGGKDGIPYRLNCTQYDCTIKILDTISKAKNSFIKEFLKIEI